jgi:hypothetical protein
LASRQRESDDGDLATNWFDQQPAWKPPEVPLDDGRIMVIVIPMNPLEANRLPPRKTAANKFPNKFLAGRAGKLYSPLRI